jgi:hypothetical protein
MKFKVGDLIAHKPMQGLGSLVEAIILEHWQTENYWTKDVVDNVHLFITFDEDDPTAVSDIDTMTGFKDQHWSLKNEV